MKITIAMGHDWEGLYIDGQLADEGHSINLRDFVSHIQQRKQPIETAVFRDVDDDWLELQGVFPRDIKEVKFVK